MEGENKEVAVTFETLFELLRREKDREELQKLNDFFFRDVVAYLKEKNQILEGREQTELFSADEKIKTEKELVNIKKIIKELYERREKKIVRMAVDKSRAKSTIIDTSAFLKEEKQLFELLVALLDKGRESIINHILDGRLPAVTEEKSEEIARPVESAKEKKSTMLVRFLHAVPRFVGPALEEYGPFEEEDVASLPAEIARVLINKGRVEELEEEKH